MLEIHVEFGEFELKLDLLLCHFQLLNNEHI